MSGTTDLTIHTFTDRPPKTTPLDLDALDPELRGAFELLVGEALRLLARNPADWLPAAAGQTRDGSFGFTVTWRHEHLNEMVLRTRQQSSIEQEQTRSTLRDLAG